MDPSRLGEPAVAPRRPLGSPVDGVVALPGGTAQGSLGDLPGGREGKLVHDPDDHLAEALDGAYPALDRLRADGTVGAIGVGVNSAALAGWFVSRCDLDCVLVAGRYTLLDDSASRSLFPLCLARGVAVLAGGVFNSGILANPADGPAAPGVLARARRIAEVCARYDIPVAAAALRYVLRHPAVTAAVVGARTPEEIRADAGYLELPIPDALWGDLAGPL